VRRSCSPGATIAPDSILPNTSSYHARNRSAQDYDQFSKGESLDQIKPMRRDGGPENSDAWKVKSDLSIESVNKRADR
jgi:hypothetical protein